MEWHPSRDKRTNIRVIGGNFPDEGKGNLVRVIGEFELPEFELSVFYRISNFNKISSSWSM